MTLSCVAALLALPGIAGASLGTGVSASPVVLPKRALQGHSYALPGLYVRNTGTERYLRVRVQRLSTGAERVLPATWITFGRNGITLSPHRSAVVPIRIAVPPTAAGGSYMSDLVASTSLKHARGGDAIGVAAATKLEVDVGTLSSSVAWGAIGLATGGILLIAGLGYLVRKSGLSVSVRVRDRTESERTKTP